MCGNKELSGASCSPETHSTFLRSYQQADEATLTQVVLEAPKLYGNGVAREGEVTPLATPPSSRAVLPAAHGHSALASPPRSSLQDGPLGSSAPRAACLLLDL